MTFHSLHNGRPYKINCCHEILTHVDVIIQVVCSKEIEENFKLRIFIHTMIIAQY